MNISFNDYQEKARRTASKENNEKSILISCMGLSGETGEAVDYLKKVYGHGHEYDHMKLISELGDILWYISDISARHGVDLETIAKQNIIKLEKRYPNGFSSEKSINRAEI